MILVKSAPLLKYHLNNACRETPKDVNQKLEIEPNKGLHKNKKSRTVHDSEEDDDVDMDNQDKFCSDLVSTLSTETTESGRKTWSQIMPEARKQTRLKLFFHLVTTIESNKLDILFARAFYSSSILFQIIEEENIVPAINGLQPSFLQQATTKQSVDLEYEHVTNASKLQIAISYGVTLVIDGWSNMRRESIINIVICSPQPVCYKSIDRYWQ